ncbi:hypothetical protein GpartN1_g347.t1 [Galdieria partita]|uniref:Uncharacterized protein n=1 Tax=Galdieria partita TaxID=83374 RepID=A0A9C7PQH0_9RHOD|nr:hypothetical protein GpartN1_g347.t1 [Galdieria partita]
MAEIAEDYDPKYEFLAPKYVNLLEAASEAALYDGADEWFDQLQSRTELVKESLVTKQEMSYEQQNSSVDTNNEGERQTGYSGQSKRESHNEQVSTLHFQETNASEKENYSGELNIRNSVKEISNSQVYSASQEEGKRPASMRNNSDNHSNQPSVDLQQHRTFLEKENEVSSDIEHYRKSEISILTHHFETSNENKIQLENKYFNNSKYPDTTTTKEWRRKSAKLIQIVGESNQNQSLSRENRGTGPPAFRTEQRAFLHKERRKSSTDFNSKVNEPRTPKNFGASWKPGITIPHSPKFRSERRLRHCVERALQQGPNGKMETSKVVRQVGGQTLTVPESPTFRTQKRAETHRALKGVPLTYEEEELQKIQAERNAVRKMIHSGQQMCARTINFNNVKSTKETNQRMATVPRTFTFATQERSLQRSNRILKEPNSKSVEQVSSNCKKPVESRNTSVTQDRKMQKIPCRMTTVKLLGNKGQTSTSLGLTSSANKSREDSSTTRKHQVASVPSRKKSSSLEAPKVDVFTRLYRLGKRHTEEPSPSTNKTLAKNNNQLRQPITLNNRSLPQIRTVSNVTSARSRKADDKRQVEYSKLRPQYAFRHNSPVHNTSRRASRVPLVENEEVVERSMKMN